MDDTKYLSEALLFHRQGNLDEAEKRYLSILENNPASADALHLLGIVKRQQGRPAEAAILLEKACELNPSNRQFHLDCGDCLRENKSFNRALDCYRRALAGSADDSSAHLKMAGLFHSMGDCDAARKSLLHVLSLKPDHLEALMDFAELSRLQGDFKTAIASLRHAVNINPDSYDAHFALGNCLRDTDALDEALLFFQTAVRLRPDSIPAHSDCGEALQTAGRLADAELHFQTAVELSEGKCARAYSNLLLCMNYNPDYEPGFLYKKHLEFGRVFDEAPGIPEKSTAELQPFKKLRIGYVSADFCNHPAARFLEPVLLNHDKNGFDVFCYSDVVKPDAVTGRCKNATLNWRDIRGRDDQKVEQAIRDDHIDILIDCSGHTGGNRLPAFAGKPAPIQISYLGYPMTTGLCALDYYLTDLIADPAPDASLFTEKLIRPGPCFCTYLPSENAPDVQSLPAKRNGFVTFGSLHPLARLNDRVIDLWAGVLKAVPGSHLHIVRTTLTGAARMNLEKMFVLNGVDLHRIEFGHEIPATGHLALYHGIDVSLDTFPWSGHTTACESLWMGVPVITLQGNRHAGRMVTSILKNMGIDDWVAGSCEDYLRIATEKASSIEDLISLRARLRETMASSDVCNAVKFTRNLEAAYRKIWIEYCKK
jgi:protein O-GlcNAc transferase